MIPATRGNYTITAPKDRLQQFLTRWFGALQKSHTLDAYRRDLMDFAVFIGIADHVTFDGKTAAQAAATLLAGAPGVTWGPGEANGVVLDYRNNLIQRGAAPATVNRRLSMLRSLVKSAKMLGVVNWDLTVPGVKSEVYRDTRGPGVEGVRRLVGYLAQRIRKGDRQAVRDYAIVRIIYDLGLRRGEVASLNLEHIDLRRNRIFVMGKGRTQRQWVTIPDPTKTAILMWMRLRQRLASPHAREGNAPLFFPLSGKGTGYLRLSETSIYRMIVTLGRKTRVKAKPHGLRHAAITEALNRTNGDVRSVMKFSRHKNRKPSCCMTITARISQAR